jgi:hypothetical protein
MSIKNSFLFLAGLLLFVLVACTSNGKEKTDEALYEKNIFTDDANKAKVKSGDRVTFYYCLKNGEKVIMSSDLVVEQTVLTILAAESLNKFERPLLWLGLGDSCVVYINSADAVTELSAYKEHFKTGDKATFIYKVLKIE